MKSLNKRMILPFLLTVFLILADQGTKSFIVKNWPGDQVFITDVFGNDMLWIIHVRNKAIAFSLGYNLPDSVKPLLFIVMPLVVLGFLLWYYVKSRELTGLQRWAVAGIIGGGAGNLIDRIFRPDGVVDFISVRFFGIESFKEGPLAFLSWPRWPTFNIADAGVVVSVFIFLFSILLPSKHTQEEPSGDLRGNIGGKGKL
ncbi:MAG: signal peptidase II [Treponema sp.]|nr:signal peptidase II [Treponema sp.]